MNRFNILSIFEYTPNSRQPKLNVQGKSFSWTDYLAEHLIATAIVEHNKSCLVLPMLFEKKKKLY